MDDLLSEAQRELIAIIESPKEWARCLARAHISEFGTDLLLHRLKAIPGPLARARECQLDVEFEKVGDMDLGPEDSHPLYRAMRLLAISRRGTPECHMFVAAQSEIIEGDHSNPLVKEAQMHWDFARGQTFEKMKKFDEALKLYEIGKRSATLLDIESMTRSYQTRIAILSPETLPDKLYSLGQVFDRGHTQGREAHISDFICQMLCDIYSQVENFTFFLEAAHRLSPSPLRIYLIAGAKLLLGKPLDAPLPKLEDLKSHQFCLMTHVLSNFIELKKTEKTPNALSPRIQEIVGTSANTVGAFATSGLIAQAIQIMTYTWLGEYMRAELKAIHLYDAIELGSDHLENFICYADMAYLDLLRKSDIAEPRLEEIRARFKTAVESNTTLRNLMSQIDAEWLCSLRMLN